MDDSGNAYITGNIDSTDFPTTAGAYDDSHNGLSDAFLIILNSTGTGLVYSPFFGGTGNESIRGIGADDDGYIYSSGIRTLLTCR